MERNNRDTTPDKDLDPRLPRRLRAGFCFALLLISLALRIEAAELGVAHTVAGTWTWGPRPEPGLIRQILLKLELHDGKLRGALTGRGPDAAIEDAKLDGNEVSFNVPRVVAQKRIIQQFRGKWEGDSIRGTIEYDKDGKHQTAAWRARRVPASEDPASGTVK